MSKYKLIMILLLCLQVSGFCAFAESVSTHPVALRKAALDDMKSQALDNLLSKTSDGFLRQVVFPVDKSRSVTGGEKNAEAIARQFLLEHGNVLTSDADNMSFELERVKAKPELDRTYLRFQQCYRGIPVYRGTVTVQIEYGQVAAVMGHLMHRPKCLAPATRSQLGVDISKESAAETATEWAKKTFADVAGIAPGASDECGPCSDEAYSVTSQTLHIYDSRTVGSNENALDVVWSCDVQNKAGSSAFRVFVSASSGDVVAHEKKGFSLLDRDVYKFFFSPLPITVYLMREEGEPPCGDPDVDEHYDILQQCYDYFLNTVGWENWENQSNETITTYINWCLFFYSWCRIDEPRTPLWIQAAYDDVNNRLLFGPYNPHLADDCVAHEWAHAVTMHASGLGATGESGAIHEALSDFWGERVDWSNGDGAVDRWKIGEDTTWGVLRDMQEPLLTGLPKEYKGTNWCFSCVSCDSAHTNCGVGSHLLYLLTDGDDLGEYGLSATGFGETMVTDLVWEAEDNLLQPGDDYTDFATRLITAAVNNGWTSLQRLTLMAYIGAVGLSPYEEQRFSITYQGVEKMAINGHGDMILTDVDLVQNETSSTYMTNSSSYEEFIVRSPSGITAILPMGDASRPNFYIRGMLYDDQPCIEPSDSESELVIRGKGNEVLAIFKSNGDVKIKSDLITD